MTVAVATIWGILLAAELVAMAVLYYFDLPIAQAIWLEPLLDATLLAVVVVFALPYALDRGRIECHSNREWLQLKAALLVFGVQSILMLSLPLMPWSLNVWHKAVVDAACFSVLSTGAIYLSILRPEQALVAISHSGYVKHNGGSPWLTFLGYYLVIMVLIGLLLLTLDRSQQADQLAKLRERQHSTLALTHSLLTHELYSSLQDLLVFTRDSDVQAYATTADAQLLAELGNDFESLVATRQAYQSLLYVDRLGGRIAAAVSGHGDNLGLISGKGLTEHQLLQDILMLGPGEVSVVPMIRSQQLSPLRLAAPVFDHQGLHHALMVVELNSHYLLQLLGDSFDSDHSALLLVSEYGLNWLVAPRTGWKLSDSQQAQLFEWTRQQQDSRSSELLEFGLASQHRLEQLPEQVTGIERFALHGGWPEWQLVSVVDSDQIKAYSQSSRWLLVMVFAIIALFSGLATLIYSRIYIRQLEVEQQIFDMAHHDSLTGLDNRQLFREKLVLELAHARRSGSWLGLIYLDLDDFKPINDSYGHDIGDQALVEVTARLRPLLRASDSFARIGGDEFAIILPSVKGQHELEQVAARLVVAMESEFVLNGHSCPLGISIGISLCRGELEVDQFIRQADMAMYSAKRVEGSAYKVQRPTFG